MTERRLLLVSIGFRGREIACLAAALGPLACLKREKERERERGGASVRLAHFSLLKASEIQLWREII